MRAAEILQDPSSQVVLPNDKATFICKVQTDGDYYVYINGYPTTPEEVAPAITINIFDLPDDTHVVTIDIIATLNFNGTSVRFVLDQDRDVGSTMAHLWIAG